MCGIFGFLASASPANLNVVLTDMQRGLAHRGPDGNGTDILPASTDRWMGLGHVRLSIVAPDAPSAAQPLHDPSGRYVMSYNGEVYNYPELMAELSELGHRFAAASDSEVLLAAYAQWGPECLNRLRGMFAVAIWDTQRRRLFLARDATGKKPLWLRACKDGVAFASEIQALTAPLKAFVGTEIDPAAVADYLLYKYVPDNRSLFRDICELPPGHWIDIPGDRPSPLPDPVRWYHAPERQKPSHDRLNSDDVTAFREALDEAVALRLRADVPVGVFLSGGIDSSAVLALAAAHVSTPMESFCVNFADGEEKYSEGWAAQMVAERYGTRHHILDLDAQGFADSLDAAVWHRGMPLGEVADVAMFKLSHLAATRVKCVLSGEGADELLAGYPRYWGEIWARRWQALAPRGLDPALRWLSSRLPYKARKAGIMLRAAAERDFATRQAGWFGALTPPERRRLAPALAGRGGAGWPQSPPDHDAAMHAAMAFDKAVWLPGNILARGDRMSMAAGVEMRMPFMDTSLAQHAAQLPREAFLTGREGKTVLRQSMKDRLPPEILARPKHGFRVPFHEWCRGPMRAMLEDRILRPGAALHAFVPRKGVETLVQDHMSRRRNHEKPLWVLLSLATFLEQWDR